jgi:hypothetical protein
MVEETLLSSSVTIARYRELEARRDREGIADFILERFSERYIMPVGEGKKQGFCTMAICCLMIEALESFYQGWPDTKTRSSEAFDSFFRRCAEQKSELGVFADHADNFYRGVRCGILHQAETARGWRIRREGPLFDPSTKIINATLFHNELEKVLMAYRGTLKQSDWDSEIWHNLRKKMEAVIENCKLG